MPRRARAEGRRVAAAASVVGACLLARSVDAERPPFDAFLECRPESVPGRVVCEVEVVATSGRLAWADVVVRDAPEFARPVRSRVGPREAVSGTGGRLRLPLALVATDRGVGELSVDARGVVCRAAKGSGRFCTPGARGVSAEVRVGEPPGAD